MRRRPYFPSFPYRLETCVRCESETWCEIFPDGNPKCRACKAELFFTEILYGPYGMELMEWQRGIIRDLYGTVDPETGLRQYRHGYLSVAKQNGKTFCLGGLPIYHLLAENEEAQPEVYGCAAAKDQAGLIFKATAMLIRRNPELNWRFSILDSTKRIIRSDSGGTYIVLSADGDVQDGIRPSLLLRDEIHRWKSARAETLYDVTTKGQISRREPLDLAITTAGAEYESPLWFREYEHAKNVLNGVIDAKTHYAAIWEADSKKLEADPEYWKSREARVAANPSHEDLGGFLRDAAIVGELEKALSQHSEKSKFLRYHLNIPLKATEDPIIDMYEWIKSDGGADLRKWPAQDVDLLIRKWNLLEKPCYAGIDASWTIDFTACVFIFPPFEEDEHGPGSDGRWTFLPFFWVPEDRVIELERICRMPIASWVERGFLSTSPGRVVDQREIKNKILWGREMFDLVAMPYDRCNFRTEALNLVDEGITAPEIPQTFMGLSHATKFLLSVYLNGGDGLRHGNHPVLNWMAACLQLQYDHKDNCQPIKPARNKSSKRIDGMQAIVTGLAQAVVGRDTKSVYEERGIRTI